MLVLVLWLMQTVFLNDFYRAIKINEIKSMANDIELLFQKEDVQSAIENVARRYDGCIVVADSFGYRTVAVDGYTNCRLMYLKGSDLKTMLIQAIANGGSYLTEHEGSTGMHRPMWFMSNAQREVFRSIIYTRVIAQNGATYGLFLNTNVIPLDATVETIRVQLIFITIGMIVFALALANFIAKHLTKPISSITASSQKLAKGNYDVSFDGTGYREVKELAATLDYAAHELGKVDRMQKELIANVSHDLRTPLTMIAGYSELMRDMPEEMTQENIQTVIDEANRLSSLVNDVLDLSKIIDGSYLVTKETCNITVLMQSIVHRYTTMLAHKGYHIDFHYEAELFVEVDISRITQVIYNLMNNAITYTGEDQSVKITQTKVDTCVRLSFTDTGEGIPQNELGAIWNRYYQAKKTHKRASIGSGLGLSIVKELVSMHGGEYGVHSEVGKGSTFWFSLPLLTNASDH